MSQSDDDDEVENWDSYDNHPSDGNPDTEALRDIDTAHSTSRTRQKLQAVVDTFPRGIGRTQMDRSARSIDVRITLVCHGLHPRDRKPRICCSPSLFSVAEHPNQSMSC
jgi:hypothetical protein